MFTATTEMSNGIMTEPSATTNATTTDSLVSSRKRSIEEVEDQQDGIIGGIVPPGGAG